MTTNDHDRRTARRAASDSCGIDGLDHVHVGLCNGLGFDAGVAWAQQQPEGTAAGQIVWAEVKAERERAHVKHGDSSMESCPPDDYRRLAILTEEVGEVAREFNEGHHRGEGPNLALLRKELIQTAAMAGAWADAIEVEQ